MKQKILLIILVLFLFSLTFVQAEDIVFSLDQSEYYFKIGEDAVINLQSENTYGEPVSGMLTYTITQSINQGNFQYSSSSTKSTSFFVDEGKKEIPINFGTSDTPMTLLVNLQFSYSKDGARMVSLDDIKIHFVSDDSQKLNEKNQVSSSSQSAGSVNQQQSDPFAQQEQRMQQMIDQFFGNNQQMQGQTAEQKLQNSQLSQDSSALKQQMAKQIQEQQQMRKEFQKQLAENPDFQREHKKLIDQGYSLTNANFNPKSGNSGEFELDYQKPNGERASLKGEMQDGEIQSLQTNTPESRQKIIDQLQKNKEFQKYQKQLQSQKYKQQDVNFLQSMNKTIVQMNYMNQNNETATIKAEVINNTIKNVELVKDNKTKGRGYWWIFILILLLSILTFFAYKKFNKKTQPEKIKIEKKIERPFDYRKEALSMLDRAEKLFEKKKYKDAYGIAGQALRLFLSYDNNLNKEMTNDEIIDYLRKHHKKYKEVKECFDLCSLVEFAKFKAKKKDFEKIINHAKKVIELLG